MSSAGSTQSACSSSLPSASGADSKPANSYGQILKSSFVIGGSTAFTIVFGIVRTKALALILGKAGFGIFGIFQSIYELARNIASMGLSNSGVRQIAEARGVGDEKTIARTVITLRRISGFLGMFGAVLLLAACVPIAQFSFEKTGYAGGVALLAAGVFFGTVATGQQALLQGMRRIGDFARANVFGALWGTVASIPLVYFLKGQGVVPALVAIALATMLSAWWYSRRIQVEPIAMTLAQIFRESSGLLKLGFVFMTTGLMVLGSNYLIRVIILRRLGEEAAGFYHAAWVLGGLYTRFIFQAMGADFLPRLTEAANDHPRATRMVNEQAEISLLLAGPGILGTLTFAPVIVQIFYEPSFAPTVDILRWFCLGVLLQVVSWPLGYVLIAKGARRAFFLAELATNVSGLALLWVCIQQFNLKGTGMAFFLMYVFYTALIYLIVRSLIRFRWSAENTRIGLIFAGLIGLLFVALRYLPTPAALALGAVCTATTGYFSVRKICTMIPIERFPRPAQRLLVLLGLVQRRTAS